MLDKRPTVVGYRGARKKRRTQWYALVSVHQAEGFRI